MSKKDLTYKLAKKCQLTYIHPTNGQTWVKKTVISWADRVSGNVHFHMSMMEFKLVDNCTGV